MDIERGSGNVYADLGMADAGGMLVKAQLASKIREVIEARKWKQAEAAGIFGVPQPKLSKMLRGEFREISESKMLNYLVKLAHVV